MKGYLFNRRIFPAKFHILVNKTIWGFDAYYLVNIERKKKALKKKKR